MTHEVTGDSDPKNIATDLFHVFEAQKYGGGHFVTFDKRLLKRADAIAELLGIEIIAPEAFVDKVRVAKQRNVEFEKMKRDLEGP